jgi:hypothetical protein
MSDTLKTKVMIRSYFLESGGSKVAHGMPSAHQFFGKCTCPQKMTLFLVEEERYS